MVRVTVADLRGDELGVAWSRIPMRAGAPCFRAKRPVALHPATAPSRNTLRAAADLAASAAMRSARWARALRRRGFAFQIRIGLPPGR